MNRIISFYLSISCGLHRQNLFLVNQSHTSRFYETCYTLVYKIIKALMPGSLDFIRDKLFESDNTFV